MNPLPHTTSSRKEQIVIAGTGAVCALGNSLSEDFLEFYFPNNPVMRL
jgi:hypothetical protein